jgi:uncharacterized protein
MSPVNKKDILLYDSVGRAVPQVKRKKLAADRWHNPINDFGTYARDPVAQTRFGVGFKLSRQILESLYENDWLTHRVIVKLAQDACKRGWQITSKKNKAGAKQINKRLMEWHGDELIESLAIEARLYGTAFLFFNVNDGYSEEMPLDVKNIRDVNWIKVVNRYYAFPYEWYREFYDKNYGNPMLYRLMFVGNPFQMPIINAHQTRLSRMDGTYQPRGMRQKSFGYADSVIQRVYETMKSFGISIQSATAIIQDFVTKVLKIDNLDDILEMNEEELEQRAIMTSVATSIHKTTVIGGDEDIKKFITPVTGLADVITILEDLVSAAADMPKSRMFGNTSGTLGSSSGNEDNKNWEDHVENMQTKKLKPPIKRLAEIAGALDNIELPDMDVEFNPLRELAGREKAEIASIEAETNRKIAETARINAEAVRIKEYDGQKEHDDQAA